MPASGEMLPDDEDALLADLVPASQQSPNVAGTGWRIERYGAQKAGDGKGRYWQWRRGSQASGRESAYGGKIDDVINTEFWQAHRARGPRNTQQASKPASQQASKPASQ
ncbi:MAG: hypothetical protein WBV59_18585 [Anaerolineae bacterium]